MGALSGWLSGFTKGTQKLLPFARAAVAEGISRTDFFNITRRAGFGARKSDVLRMMRDLQNTYQNPDTYLDQTSGLAKPIPDLVPRALGPTARAYQWNVRVTRFDEISGVDFDDYVSINSSVLLSNEDVYEVALDEFNAYELPSKVKEDSIRITGVTFSDAPRFRTP